MPWQPLSPCSPGVQCGVGEGANLSWPQSTWGECLAPCLADAVEFNSSDSLPEPLGVVGSKACWDTEGSCCSFCQKDECTDIWSPKRNSIRNYFFRVGVVYMSPELLFCSSRKTWKGCTFVVSTRTTVTLPGETESLHIASNLQNLLLLFKMEKI